MLDFFSIFTRGGLVLWFIQASNVDFVNSVNHMISDVILQEKTDNTFKFEKFTLEFKVSNEQNLIYVAGYHTVLRLPYIKELLKAIQFKFGTFYSKNSLSDSFDEFTPIYKEELKSFEDKHREIPNGWIIADPSKFMKESDTEPAIIQPNKVHEKKTNYSPKKKTKTNKHQKVARTWGDKIGKYEIEALDYSDAKFSVTNHVLKAESRPISKILPTLASDLIANSAISQQTSKVYQFFKSLAVSTALTTEALSPVMQKMAEHLCAKNVAYDISQKICKSVSDKLVGVNVSAFSRINSVVQSSMEESLMNILSPKRAINILHDIQENKSERPFVITFCGVNGVGKSTNLAKIAHYLLNNGKRVFIAACDTFRSGAVEQLKTHVCRLNSIFVSDNDEPNCSLFEKGYGRDASGVAMEAIKAASKLNYDVVLIDTAGRMQDNEPLMRSLAKLIKVNQPDLILFVGEALVGNDGVDQLNKFNRSLSEFSDDPNPHLIDGIVLTKFDTIDDKVGAALSMTYTTGQPIIFVGVGQTYSDLRIFDVKSVVQLLLK